MPEECEKGINPMGQPIGIVGVAAYLAAVVFAVVVAVIVL